MKPINVLSLFDGMSCTMVALNRLDIPVSNYYSSETDKYAIEVSQDNHYDITQVGDVNYWTDWDIDWASIDLVIGGSPCQGFSFAGKQLAFDDPRSALFFRYVEILNYVLSKNPEAKFVLENVKMKKANLDVISDFLKVEPVLINSNLVSAQNRQRYYWTNIEGVEQPKDKEITFNEILQIKTQDKFNVSDHQISRLDLSNVKEGPFRICFKSPGQNINKSEALLARHYKGISGKQYFPLVCYKKNNTLFYRKLTPIECERLQTLPDNYTSAVSNTQRYKMLGNGFTVDVIAHILSYEF